MAQGRKWWWLIGLAIIMLAGIGYALLGEPPAPPQVEDQPPALVEFKGADLRQEEDGRLVWKLTAEKIMMNPQTKVVYLENAEALFTEGENQIHVKAEKGELDNTKKTIVLIGSVEIRSNEDAYVNAKNLRYDGDTELLTITDGVILRRGDITLTGDKLEADRGLRNAKVSGNAKLVKGDIL